MAGAGENGAAPGRAEAGPPLPGERPFSTGPALRKQRWPGFPAEGTVVVPLKFTFDDTDLHGGFSLEELTNQPVVRSGGWVCIPAAADEGPADRGLRLPLWLYASETGRQLMGSGSAEGPARTCRRR